MPNPHGSFIWYELITNDPDAAARFYGGVLDWTVRDFGDGAPGYRIFSAGETGVAGLMPIDREATQAGMKPGWFGYIGVDDVDSAVSNLLASGGTVHVPAWDIQDVGRIAMVADPQRVPFYLMRGASPQSSTAFAVDTVGHCAWNELSTTDLHGALAFYPAQFGWTEGGVMDMGDKGGYHFLDRAGDRIGAMMTRVPDGPPPRWTFYFRVADIDAATSRAASAGATIFHGPAQVPGDLHIVIGADPQGAIFAMVGMRGAA